MGKPSRTKHGTDPATGQRVTLREVSRGGSPGQLVRHVLQLALTAVVVATPLIPSDAPASGTGVLLILLWLLLLLAWSVSNFVWSSASWRWGWVDSWVLVFLALHTASGWVAVGRGDARAAINLLWQWGSFGACFFLVRQLIQQPREGRALCAVGVSLAVGLAAFGGYEYAHLMPLRRAQYAANPEQSLREAGLDFRPGSPERKLYEDRLRSTEPSATFALTNSLAGFLAPWFVLTLAVGAAGKTRPGHRAQAIAKVGGIAVLLGLCLLLTKSRSAWLATGLGAAAVGWSVWRGGRRVSWRTALIGLAVLAGLAIGISVAGGLDRLVISEAPKSLRYRLQYWQATLHMIADHPWFGCGPGNFQHYYPAYKLPEASETIADPHNLVMEIWATAGTPTLLAFAAIGAGLGGVLWSASRRVGRDADTSDVVGLKIASPSTARNAASAPRQSSELTPVTGGNATGWIYAGGVSGLLLAYPCGAVSGFMPDVDVLLIVLPTAMLSTLLLSGWVQGGCWRPWMLLVPLGVLLVHLLAAGGISFAGVAQTGWLLLALVLNQLEGRGGAERERSVSRVVAGAAAVVGLLLAVAYLQTMYGPILKRQVYSAAGAAAEAEARWDVATADYEQAAIADPYSVEPWFRLAWLAQQRALAAATPDRLQRFEQVAAEIVRRNPHSQVAWKQIGDWRLALYRATADRVQLTGAIDAYRQCVRLYPNGSLGHAQLAWAYHLAGDREAASAAAQEALRLDALNPHEERALAQQRLWDPQGNELREENAEQCMQRLRK